MAVETKKQKNQQQPSHVPDLDNIEVLCREDKLIPRKLREVISTRKETSPALNKDGGTWTFKDIWFTSRKTKFKDTANSEFRKWISQSQFSYHPLRTEKGFSETFGSKTWVLLNSFKYFLVKYSIHGVTSKYEIRYMNKTIKKIIP